MQNCNYVYIELLRQVCPDSEPFIDFDFFLLGSFDAMSVDIGTDIADLKKKYESKYSKVLSVFDRQPIYLYSKDEVNLKASDLSDNIFSTKKENACIPLILTLFQLDKIKLSNNKSSSPKEIIDRFTSIIKENISSENTEFKVFWNLGESDIVVVFRSIYLKEISDLLHVFRVNGVNSNTIDIISTASHCAFPKPDNIKKDTEGSVAKAEILKNLNEWLWEPKQPSTHNQLNEHCQYDSSSFITLGNVASCDDPEFSNDKAFDFLFGEWDYMLKFKDLEELKEHMMDTFMCLITSHGKLSRYAPFRVSYTIPLFPVPKIEIKKSGLKNKNNKKKKTKQNRDLFELSKSMNKIKELITNSDYFPAVRKEGLTKEIASFNNTLTGLGQFLYRLKIGRFEEDLYVYIQPVFVRLKKITNDYAKSIDTYLKKENVNDADNLIIEYISDIADLTEKLQHLFSIMAVSPHTYMETYGSNMRSLAAADKLLDSYQGIIQFLKDSFPDIIDLNDKSKSSGREILIFPHRKTQSHHNLLFFHSSPENRIAYISLDFTKMFRLKGTIFMLLHECGHHLGDRSREERFKLFYAALICVVLCWVSADDYLNNPIECLVRITNSKDLYSAKDGQMSLLLKGLSQNEKDDIITRYSESIRKAVRDGVQKMGDGLYKDRDLIENYNNYYKRISKAPYEGKLWKNYYSEQVLSYLQIEGIPQYFGLDKNEMNTQFREGMSKAVKEMIEANLAEKLKTISANLANEILEKNGNIREALRIKTMYGDTKQIADDFYEPIEEIISAKWNERAFQNIFDVFSDIYADLFAINLLDVKYKEYVEIIPEILGMEKIASSTDKRNLLRFYVVAKTAFKRTDLKSFAKSFNTDISKEMMEIWDLFEYKPYLFFLVEYAKKCSETLANEIGTLKNNKELYNSLEQLREMFRNSGKQIDGIYHFYQYLMKSRS